MKRTILTFLFMGAALGMQARQYKISPDVMAASGGTGEYQGHKVNWTLGETVIDGGSYNSQANQVTGGFNQG